MIRQQIAILVAVLAAGLPAFSQVVGIQPDAQLLDAGFSSADGQNFQTPPKVFYPETWFHFIGDNVSREGVEADLQAIKDAGIVGIQWFHGAFGGRWPGVENPIIPLSKEWDEMAAFLAETAREKELRLTLQTCPGWAMAGGPWVEPSNAMRSLVWSRSVVKAGEKAVLPLGQPSDEEWRDYQDVCVLAFPTPLGDCDKPIVLENIESSEPAWAGLLAGGKAVSEKDKGCHKVSFTLPEGAVVRTMELPSVNSMNHSFNYTPDIHIQLFAIDENGGRTSVLDVELPMASWQDGAPVVLAVNEARARRMELTFTNAHELSLSYLHLYTAARKNEWQAEAGRTLRAKEFFQEHPLQDPRAYVDPAKVLDLSGYLRSDGLLNWTPSEGEWTILRFGHVNFGRKNGPAPAEATGWECDKLDTRGADVQFTNYVGRLQKGPMEGLASGMLMDSWECSNQTWTHRMEEMFAGSTGYALRKWMPSFAGYVMESQEVTSRFLTDWRRTVTGLYNRNFFKRMTDLAHEAGLDVQYETAAGDVVAADILEYYKYADVPMCEFWHPISEGYVGDLNFKPIKPTASAAHVYGKRRVAAESFTSFDLNWDEHWEMLKEVANLNMTEGVSHNVFHTYTHNPQIGFLPPGTSFGNKIGTPFLRGQTWWKYMKEFTTYLARTSYMLERGKPVVDVLWYLGDEVSHKPNQKYPFPEGFKYDYCNPDVLLNRLSVRNGRLCTPEGIEYEFLWIPENQRMLPQTLEKIQKLVKAGAKVVAAPPKEIATLSGGEQARKKFRRLVSSVWKMKGVYDISLEDAIKTFGLKPRIKAEGGEIMWANRTAPGASWYYVTAPVGGEFHGDVSFRAVGGAEIWDAVTGCRKGVETIKDGEYQTLRLDLERAQNCFVVFREEGALAPEKEKPAKGESIGLKEWTIAFPDGWGAPAEIKVERLLPWKDLDLGEEGRAFSGTAVYTSTFDIPDPVPGGKVLLDLGKVDMIADVSINGKKAAVLWARPYKLDISSLVKPGLNTISIDVTGTWFNRLVYDASQSEQQRKTWTIAGPEAGKPLRESGLMGPVVITY